MASINSGLLQCAIQAIRVSLPAIAKKQNHTFIGLAMVDVRTHFICLKEDRIQDVIVADYEESFPCVPPQRWLTEVNEGTLEKVLTEVFYERS